MVGRPGPESLEMHTDHRTYHENFVQGRDYEQIGNHRQYSDSRRSERRNRLILGAILALTLIGIAIDYFTQRKVENACFAFIHWVEANPLLGVVAVIGVYTLATILFIPGAILTIGSGFAFRSAFDSTYKGVAFASFSVFLGASLGSICSFLLGRYLFRNWVVRMASNYPILRAIDRALETNGFRIMLLLRLSPLIPFNALDYISGVTSISLRDYALALCGILPGTIMFCMVGATASSLADADSMSGSRTLRIISLVSGLLFAVLGVSAASYYSKSELNKILQENEGCDPDGASNIRTVNENDPRERNYLAESVP